MLRRLLPATLVALVGIPLLASPARADLLPGSWSSPTSGQSVTGVVALSFSSTGSSVTFKVPQGTIPATLSGGTATASWSTLKLPNGPATLIATECDLTGCDDVSEGVTVANPVPVLQAQSQLSPGSTVQVSASAAINAANGPIFTRLSFVDTLDASKTHADVIQSAGAPYSVTIPNDFAAGTWTVDAAARFQCDPADAGLCPTVTRASFSLLVTTGAGGSGGTPHVKTISPAKTFHPVRDGVADEITATATLDTTGRVRMVVSKGHKVVKRGGYVSVSYSGQVVTVKSGRGLKPGKYSYVVEALSSDGHKATSARHSVTGDAKRLRSVTTVFDRSPADVPGQDVSGRCSSAKLDGSAIALRSNDSCQGSESDNDSDVATAVFFPALQSAASYGSIHLDVTTSGTVDAILVYQGGASQIVASKDHLSGTTDLALSGSVLSPSKHQLQFVLGNVEGHRGEITHIRITYVRKVLQ